MIFSKNKDILHMLVVFSIIAFVYMWSTPRTVVFEDDGLFIMAAYFNGIAHAPGYPLFTLLGHLATYIPFGSIAYRVHILSGILGALSCVCVWYVARLLITDYIYAYTAALGFGISRIFWSQSIIAEVYSLNVLIFLILVILSIYLARDEQGINTGKLMKWMGFIYGLGLSNHWPLLILSTPMLLAIVLPRWKSWLPHIPKALLFLLLGLLPYAWMIWRSHMNPTISFYGPIDSFSDFWFTVSRQGYVEGDHNIGAGLYDKIMFCGFLLKETVSQYGWFQTVFVIIGIFSQWKYLHKNLCIALILGYLGSTFLLNGLLGFTYDPLHRDLFKVYPVIAYVVVSLWMVLGLKYILAKSNDFFQKYVNFNFIKVTLCILVLFSEFFINLPYNYRAGDRLAEEYGLAVFETLPADAVFITFTDVETGTLGYLNLIQKVRPDVSIINSDGLVFSNRLFHKANIDQEQKYEILSSYLKAEERPIYFVRGIPSIYGSNDYGIYLKLDKTLEKDVAIAVANPRLIKFYESLLAIDDLEDPWESMVRHLIISDYCRITTRLYVAKIKNYDFNKLNHVCRGFQAILSMTEILLENPNPDLAFLRKKLDEAKSLKHEALTVEDIARLETLYGRVLMLDKHNEQALEYFQNSLKIWPHEKNGAREYIKELAQQQSRMSQ